MINHNTVLSAEDHVGGGKIIYFFYFYFLTIRVDLNA